MIRSTIFIRVCAFSVLLVFSIQNFCHIKDRRAAGLSGLRVLCFMFDRSRVCDFIGSFVDGHSLGSQLEMMVPYVVIIIVL